MAVMAARSVAKRLVRIQKLKSLYLEEVEEMRRDTVKTLVNALWRRYGAHQIRETPRPFVQWLADKRDLEATFMQTNLRDDTSGTGLPNRRRWSFQYGAFLTRRELTLADDASNRWVCEALNVAVNDLHNDPEWVIEVEMVELPALVGMKRYERPSGTSLVFTKKPRPVNPDEEAID